MKSRQLNKLYQMMRVSRFYSKYKTYITAPTAKKTIKLFNEKLDDLLVNALQQKEDIKYASRDYNDAREKLMGEVITAGKVVYYLADNVKPEDLYFIQFSYTKLKSASKHKFAGYCTITVNVIRKYANELKECGIKEKDIVRIEGCFKKFQSLMSMPGHLKLCRKVYTENVKVVLDELNKMQREKLDSIANCIFDSQTIKSEYRKARKYVKHKHPQGMFDEMLKWYRGGKKLRSRKQARTVKNASYKAPKIKKAELSIAE